jgi:hypothetical protein
MRAGCAADACDFLRAKTLREEKQQIDNRRQNARGGGKPLAPTLRSAFGSSSAARSDAARRGYEASFNVTQDASSCASKRIETRFLRVDLDARAINFANARLNR